MASTWPVAAAGSAIAGMIVIGLADNFVVFVSDRLGLWQFHLFRSAFALPMVLVVAALGYGALRPAHAGRVALRSAVVGGAMVFYIASLALMPIADAVAGLFTAPIWMLVIESLLLSRRVGPWRVGAAAVGFVGALLVLRPDAGSAGWVSVLPLIAGVLYACGGVMTRHLCPEEGLPAVLAGFFIALGAYGAIAIIVLAFLDLPVPAGHDGFVLRGWITAQTEDVLWVLAQATGSIVGIGLLTRAYQWSDASYVAVFEYTLLITASFWGYLLHGTTIDAVDAVGIALIIVSGVVLVHRERLAKA